MRKNKYRSWLPLQYCFYLEMMGDTSIIHPHRCLNSTQLLVLTANEKRLIQAGAAAPAGGEPAERAAAPLPLLLVVVVVVVAGRRRRGAEDGVEVVEAEADDLHAEEALPAGGVGLRARLPRRRRAGGRLAQAAGPGARGRPAAAVVAVVAVGCFCAGAGGEEVQARGEGVRRLEELGRGGGHGWTGAEEAAMGWCLKGI